MKCRITIWFSSFTLTYIPRGIESRGANRSLHTHVHSSNIHKSQKVGSNPSVHWQRNKTSSMQTVEYDSVLQTKEIRSPATTWMNFEDIKLSEISQLWKDKSSMVPLKWGPKSHQIHRDRKENGGGARSWGELVFHGNRGSVWEHDKFLEMVVVLVTQCQALKNVYSAVLWWQSRLGIQHCHCCGKSSIPGTEISTCCRYRK